MRIQVIGKSHREGTSKRNGAPYSFHELHYVGSDRFVVGEKGMSFTMDGGLIPFADIVIGSIYNVEFDPSGRCVAIAPVKG